MFIMSSDSLLGSPMQCCRLNMYFRSSGWRNMFGTILHKIVEFSDEKMKTFLNILVVKTLHTIVDTYFKILKNIFTFKIDLLLY